MSIWVWAMKGKCVPVLVDIRESNNGDRGRVVLSSEVGPVYCLLGRSVHGVYAYPITCHLYQKAVPIDPKSLFVGNRD